MSVSAYTSCPGGSGGNLKTGPGPPGPLCFTTSAVSRRATNCGRTDSGRRSLMALVRAVRFIFINCLAALSPPSSEQKASSWSTGPHQMQQPPRTSTGPATAESLKMQFSMPLPGHHLKVFSLDLSEAWSSAGQHSRACSNCSGFIFFKRLSTSSLPFFCSNASLRRCGSWKRQHSCPCGCAFLPLCPSLQSGWRQYLLPRGSTTMFANACSNTCFCSSLKSCMQTSFAI